MYVYIYSTKRARANGTLFNVHGQSRPNSCPLKKRQNDHDGCKKWYQQTNGKQWKSYYVILQDQVQNVHFIANLYEQIRHRHQIKEHNSIKWITEYRIREKEKPNKKL